MLNRMTKIINRANKRRELANSGKCKGLKVKWHRFWKQFHCNYVGAFLLMAMATLTSCDEHKDFPDLTMKIGHVLCTDGKVMSVADCENNGKEPIAVVFFINTDESREGNGYAVYLRDLPEAALADSIGIVQNTSADITAYDGNANTYAIYACTGCGSPAANAVFDMWRYGQSAYIPSVAQMRLLYAAKSAVNPIIERCGGEPLPDAASEVWYWTSTEVSGQETAKAWLYSLGSGAMQETPKLQEHKVRPIVTLND